MNKKFWLAKGAKIFAFAIIGGSLFTYFVMSLWNWLMPVIFGLTIINFWQALGLLVLSKILFGGWGGKGGRGWSKHNSGNWRHNMHEKWNAMSDEEKQNFKAKMKNRCGNDKWSRFAEKDSKQEAYNEPND